MKGARPGWTRIATYSLISTIAIGFVLFFAIPDSRWIAGVVLGVGLLEAAFLALVLPRLTGEEDGAEILDGDWGQAPPSGPDEPTS
jgi:hypothetical protein